MTPIWLTVLVFALLGLGVICALFGERIGAWVIHAWFARKSRMRAREMSRAVRACAPLLDAARAKCAIANIGTEFYDVTAIYNCLHDTSALSPVRLCDAITRALVDECIGEFAENDTVYVQFAGQHKQISARLRLVDKTVKFCLPYYK